MKKLAKFFSLSLGDKRLLAEALFWVVLLRFKLWVFPYKWFGDDPALIETLDTNDADVDWSIVEKVASSVRETSRFVPYASCLTQALATRTLLMKRGQVSSLSLGVDKNANGFEAHAWVEVNGRIIIGKLPRHHRFAVLDSRSLTV